MTILVEGNKSIWLGAQAYIVDTSKELAWAEKYIGSKNPAYAYILGKFVEADRANNNKQFFDLDSLRMSAPSIAHAPMNVNHTPRRIVGAYVATELVYPLDESAAENKAYIEALGVFWKHYFPDDYAVIDMAAQTGQLFYSMECVPERISCAGELGCGNTFEYDGRYSPTYCAHLNKPGEGIAKHLLEPHFVGGALIVPPEKPGWSNASIDQISSLIKDNATEAEMAYEGVKEEMNHLDPAQWEFIMGELLSMANKNAK